MLHNDIIYDFNGKTKPSSPFFSIMRKRVFIKIPNSVDL